MKSCAMTAVSWPISVWACSFDSREKAGHMPIHQFQGREASIESRLHGRNLLTVACVCRDILAQREIAAQLIKHLENWHVVITG